MDETMPPKVAYRGTLAIGDLKLPLLILTDGRRLITTEGLRNFVDWLGVQPEDVRTIPGLAKVIADARVIYEEELP
jgi:hypothetical protein